MPHYTLGRTASAWFEDQQEVGNRSQAVKNQFFSPFVKTIVSLIPNKSAQSAVKIVRKLNENWTEPKLHFFLSSVGTISQICLVWEYIFLPDAVFYCFQTMFHDYHGQCRHSVKIARPGLGGRAEFRAICMFSNDRQRNLFALNLHKIKRNFKTEYTVLVFVSIILLQGNKHSANAFSFFVYLTFRQKDVLWYHLWTIDLVSATTLDCLDWIGFKITFVKKFFPFLR